MSINFIPHGETLLNLARTQPPSDTPLSPRGLAQAQAVAQRLAGLEIAAITSSHLPRARMTAEAISRASGLPVDIDEQLQERNFGELRGRPYDSLGFDPLQMAEAPPGGESASEFQQRVAAVFARLVERHRTLAGHLVVVTHGLLIHALLRNQVRPGRQHTLPERLGNTSVTAVCGDAPHEVELLDCSLHLEEFAADPPLGLSGA